jgi:hypothetical protein
MRDAFQTLATAGHFAKCCRCGVVEVPGRGRLDEAGMIEHAREIALAVSQRSWSEPLGTAEAVETYAQELRKGGWHISKTHLLETALCPRCWSIEKIFLL